MKKIDGWKVYAGVTLEKNSFWLCLDKERSGVEFPQAMTSGGIGLRS